MPKRAGPKTEQAAIRVLRESGYQLRRPGDYVKRGLEVDKQLYAEFTEIRRKLSLKAYEALALAMSDWIKKHSRLLR